MVSMKIPQSVRALIEAGTPAHLITLNPDGSPQVTVVWIGLDGDDVVSGHIPENRKVKNIRRDPRVAISLQATTRFDGADRVYSSMAFTSKGGGHFLRKLASTLGGGEVPQWITPAGYMRGGEEDRWGPWAGPARMALSKHNGNA
jgi:hypothetical protein